MDPDFLKNLEYFTPDNEQAVNFSGQQSVESSAAAAARNSADADFWEALAGARPGASGSSSQPSSTFSPFPQSTAPSGYPYRPSNAHNARQKRAWPSKTTPQSMSPSVREGHDQKRQKADTDTATLESADYWIQFDDDDGDANLGGSYEIDFSKRQNLQNPAYNFVRPGSRLNPLPTTPGLGTGLYTNPPFQDDQLIDDNALDNALSDDEDLFDSMNLSEQLSSVDTQPPQDVPPREGLYSTPLSWERPAPGVGRLNPVFGINTPVLDPEQRRLLAIALNTGGSSTGLAASGFGSGAGADVGSEYSSMGNVESSVGTASLSDIFKGTGDDSATSKGKGKAKELGESMGPPPPSADTGTKVPRTAATKGGARPSGKNKDKVKPGDRTAHNDIERKYRTNLKDKIAELRDAVPSLSSAAEEGEEEEEEEASRSGAKVSKGTILLKATEYIHQLEKRNKVIMKEHQDLAKRLQAFEQLLTAVARQPIPTDHSRALFDPRGFC